MPFAVRQWPVAPDPRSPLFSFAGWDWGQVVSWQWKISTTNATGDYAFLNDGLVLEKSFDDTSFTRWKSTDVPLPVTEVRLQKEAFIPPVGMPLVSISLTIDILSPSIPRVINGDQQFLFPKAIRVFGPFAMTDVMGPVTEIPDGLTITPAKWDFELP